MYAEILEKINEAREKGETSLTLWKPMLSGPIPESVLVSFEKTGYKITDLKNSFVFDWSIFPADIHGLYEIVTELINIVKSEGKEKYTSFPYVLPVDVKKKLEDDGYKVNPFGKFTIIDWKHSNSGTSGKISVPTIIDFITDLAKRNIRNIFMLLFFLLLCCGRPTKKQILQNMLNIAAYDSVAQFLKRDDDSVRMGILSINQLSIDYGIMWEKAKICRDSFKAYNDESNYKKWSAISDSVAKEVKVISLDHPGRMRTN